MNDFCYGGEDEAAVEQRDKSPVEEREMSQWKSERGGDRIWSKGHF